MSSSRPEVNSKQDMLEVVEGMCNFVQAQITRLGDNKKKFFRGGVENTVKVNKEDSTETVVSFGKKTCFEGLKRGWGEIKKTINDSAVVSAEIFAVIQLHIRATALVASGQRIAVDVIHRTPHSMIAWQDLQYSSLFKDQAAQPAEAQKPAEDEHKEAGKEPDLSEEAAADRVADGELQEVGIDAAMLSSSATASRPRSEEWRQLKNTYTCTLKKEGRSILLQNGEEINDFDAYRKSTSLSAK